MNGWFGRVIGFFIGWFFAGPAGAMLGLLLGNFVDRKQSGHTYYSHTEQKSIQDIYFKTTFLVMGHLAKSDGRVSENEIRAAKNVMDKMRLSKNQRQRAIELFQAGKKPDFNLTEALDKLIQKCHRQKVLLQMFVEIQFTAAKTDGLNNANKRKILETICQRLGYRPIFYYQHYENSQQSSRQRPQYSSQSDYQLLEIKPSASEAEIKRAYRRQMSRNHPDKLIAQGLPDEMIKIANQKTQRIRSAYERIKKARRFK